MAKYDLVIFDVDGTLLDTTDGVLAAVRYTIGEFGFTPLPEEKLLKFIGPPIQNSFADAYGLSGDILQEIATVFRNRYSQHDLFGAVPYDGIFPLMEALKDNGIMPAVATYKREDYALTLLKHFGFDRYSSIMHGGDHENKLKKADIIQMCISESGISDKKRIVMIGDTENDAVGAEKIGVDFLAVTYGFGFKTPESLNSVKYAGVSGDVPGLLEFIL